jgi:hypothetical protein
MDELGMNTRAADGHDIQSDAPLRVADDGLYTPEIKRHSVEKIRLHNRYARIFASSMRHQWPQLAYVGLYSGPGRARIAGTSQLVHRNESSVTYSRSILPSEEAETVRTVFVAVRTSRNIGSLGPAAA